jgi:RecB family exonuclease
VPFTVESAPDSARVRRAVGLLELVARGLEAPLGVVLAVAAERLEAACGAPVADLRLAFARLGARSLGAAARVATPERALRLPVADRFDAAEDGGRLRSRELPPAAVARAVERLDEIARGREPTAPPPTLGERVGQFASWLGGLLPDGEAAALAEPLAALAGGATRSLRVDSDEWRRLVEAAWGEVLGEPRGAGAGVALLSVTAARGRTFERLALVGMTRDRFPRPVRSDPLLPDVLRLRLRELLPDLPVKAEGHDEERFLFAQLVAAAREIALFRPLADGQGRSLPPSPLLDELARHHGSAEAVAPLPPRPSALEAAIEAALAGKRDRLASALAAAVVESRRRFADRSAVAAGTLATTRLALLARRGADPADAGAARLGPYLGAVGAAAAVDPRRRSPSVTALESLARCGWRLFLERVLRLAPLPDLVDALPSLPARLAGTVVHRLLEQMTPDRRGLPLAEAVAAEPVAVAWPGAAALNRGLLATARRALAEEGLDPALFEAALAREAQALLETARRHDWPAGRRELLAVEAGGEAIVEAGGGVRRIPFVADRVERIDGELWLTDYKTGQPISDAVRPATRARHLAAKVASGEALQLAVYLLGGGARAARARYLNLHDGLDERAREIALAPAELAELPLSATLDTLFAAWDTGAFVPRLVDRDLRTTSPECAFCEVREACVQGDSAARQRQARWAAATPRDAHWERAARGWWELRPARRGGGEAEPA